MAQLLWVAATAFAIWAGWLDWKTRKIPNWLISIGLLSGVLLNAINGGSHFFQSILGLVIGIIVLLVPFACGWIGAGDVKFFGVIGALLGGWIFTKLGIFGGGFLFSLAAATVGAVVLVSVARMFSSGNN